MTTATLTRTLMRGATVEDVPSLVAIGRRFRAEVYAARLPESPMHMAQLAQQLLTSETGTIFVAEREGRLVGVIGAIRFIHPLSGVLTAAELFWYVEPEVRGSVGLRLLRQAEAWARAAGCVRMQLIAPSDRTAQLYDRLGYQRVEVAFEGAL